MVLLLVSLIGCTEKGDAVDDPSEIHPAFADFDADNFDFYLSGDTVTIDTNGMPNHETPYWDPSDDRYIDGESGFAAAPGYISESPMTLQVDVEPAVASSSTQTGLGPIGFAVSGAVIYNGEEGPNVPIDDALVSLDFTGAHTGPMSYHYHLEPVAWSEDDNALIGIMSDGFFIYGRRDVNGDYPTDLDASGGHTSVTPHSDEEEYHYHIINEAYLGAYYLIFTGDYMGTPYAISG